MSFVTFKTLSSAGNLCSQMQQYASLYAIAAETKKEIVFPISSKNQGFGFKFADALDIPIRFESDEFFNDFIDIRVNDSILLDENVFKLDPDVNYNFGIRFDSLHYWYPKYADDIANIKWNSTYLESATNQINAIRDDSDGCQLVSLHVRRGDYLLPQHNHFCQLDALYYSAAIKTFTDKGYDYKFVVFSNDIEWCKENLVDGDMVHHIDTGNDCNDLVAMSLCDHNIIANSSYSMWAALRNRHSEKIIVCPENYLRYDSPWAHLNGNYYPSNWLALNNINR